MRKSVFMLSLLAMSSIAVAAPVLRPRPSQLDALKALIAAGAPATDSEVSAAYPRFMLHPNPPAQWFVASTDDGCLYYAYDANYDPPGTRPGDVADWMRDHFHVKWIGTHCTPGQPISGQGTLAWVDANLRNSGHRDDRYDSLTGTMHNGVFSGSVQRDFSHDEAKKRTIRKETFEMFGGCPQLDPKNVVYLVKMCQPRVR